MAFILNTDNEKRDKQIRQQGQELGVDVPASIPVANPSASQPGTPEAQRSSGRWTNLQKYLNVNKGQGDKLATDISGSVTNQTNQAKSDLNNEYESTYNKAAENGAVLRPTLVTAGLAAKDGTDDASKALQKEYQDYQDYLAKGYQGPQALDPDKQREIQDKLQASQANANLSNTEGGRTDLLKTQFAKPTYTSGQTKLDQMLLQNDPNARLRFQALRTMADEVNNSEVQSANDRIKQAADQQQKGFQYGSQQLAQAKGETVATPMEKPLNITSIQSKSTAQLAYEKALADKKASEDAEIKAYQDAQAKAESDKLGTIQADTQKKAEEQATAQQTAADAARQQQLDAARQAAETERQRQIQDMVEKLQDPETERLYLASIERSKQEAAAQNAANQKAIDDAKTAAEAEAARQKAVQDKAASDAKIKSDQDALAQAKQLAEQEAQKVAEEQAAQQNQPPVVPPQNPGQTVELPQYDDAQNYTQVNQFKSQLSDLNKQLNYIGTPQWQTERDAARQKYGPTAIFKTPEQERSTVRDQISQVQSQLSNAQQTADSNKSTYEQQLQSYTDQQVAPIYAQMDKLQQQLSSIGSAEWKANRDEIVKKYGNVNLMTEQQERDSIGKQLIDLKKQLSAVNPTKIDPNALSNSVKLNAATQIPELQKQLDNGNYWLNAYNNIMQEWYKDYRVGKSFTLPDGKTLADVQNDLGVKFDPIQVQAAGGINSSKIQDSLLWSIMDGANKKIQTAQTSLEPLMKDSPDNIPAKLKESNDLLNLMWKQAAKAFSDGVLKPTENPQLYQAITGQDPTDPNAVDVKLPNGFDVSRFSQPPEQITADDFKPFKQLDPALQKYNEQVGQQMEATKKVVDQLNTQVSTLDQQRSDLQDWIDNRVETYNNRLNDEEKARAREQDYLNVINFKTSRTVASDDAIQFAKMKLDESQTLRAGWERQRAQLKTQIADARETMDDVMGNLDTYTKKLNDAQKQYDTYQSSLKS